MPNQDDPEQRRIQQELGGEADYMEEGKEDPEMLQQMQEEEEVDENINRDVWKKFGRGNEIGNMLFSMYSAKEKPKINYPKPKGKKRAPPEVEQAMSKVGKKCP